MRHKHLWEREFAYELRTLKLVGGCGHGEGDRILCGDKSGRVSCLDFDGRSAWRSPPREPQFRGPVYDLVVLHAPPAAGIDQPARACLVAGGSGSGELLFFDYRNGSRISLAVDLGSPVLALLYLEDVAELWVTVADGKIHRFAVDWKEAPPSLQRRQPIELGAAVVALAFVPKGRSGAGWVYAATTLGNVFRVDPFAPGHDVPPILLWHQAPGPIRACESLSCTSTSGERLDIVTVAAGDGLRCLIEERDDANAPLAVSERRCADSVHCLAHAHFEDAVWLLAGANDRRLHFYQLSVGGRAASGACSLNDVFHDVRRSIRFDGRVLLVAVREQQDAGAGCNEALSDLRVFVALEDHKLQALRIVGRRRYVEGLNEAFEPTIDLEGLLAQLRRAPDDAVLRRKVIGLLFGARWLLERLSRPWDREDDRRLRLVLYSLLTGASGASCREVQAGLVEIAAKRPAFRPLAAEIVRHVDKYCIGGQSFSEKARHIDRLASFNERAGGDYLYDAALYHGLLSTRRYTDKQIFELPGQPWSLCLLDGVAELGPRPVLATSNEEGRAWILGSSQFPVIEMHLPEAGGEQVPLQHVLVWPTGGARHLIFFYRDLGWASSSLDQVLNQVSPIDRPEDRFLERGLSRVELPLPRPVRGTDAEDAFNIYSSAVLSDELVAVGGRFTDVRLLRIGATGQLEVETVGPVLRGDASGRYAPVWSLAYCGGDLFAGCEDGACYRLPFDGRALGDPQLVWRSLSAVRVVVPYGPDRLVVGDASGFLVILQRTATHQYSPVWMIKLYGAVTAIAPVAQRVPAGSTGNDGAYKTRALLLVSDSHGVIHIVRPDIYEHVYAINLRDGERAAIERLIVLPSDPNDHTPALRVAVACFDKTIRTLSLPYRGDSARRLETTLARLAIARLAHHKPPLSEPAESAMTLALAEGLNDSARSIPEIVRRVVEASLHAGTSVTEDEVRAALEEVALKLKSVNVRAEAPGLLALRLRYDDAGTFASLLDELHALVFEDVRATDGARPHLRLKYCLRFAFKSIATLLGDGAAVSPVLRGQLARFVHLCHSLCQNWGPDSSEDNARAQLDVAHNLFEFATPAMLDWLLGGLLDPDLATVGARRLADLVGGRLLHDPRLSVAHRTVQYIRRMIARDSKRVLRKQVIEYIVPLLIRRVRSCLASAYDWVGMGLFLCVKTLEDTYSYSQWEFVTALLEAGCPPLLLEFIASRQEILPPSDARCCAVVRALGRPGMLSARDDQAAEGRAAVFDVLFPPSGDDDGVGPALRRSAIDLIRCMLAVGVAFDPQADVHQQRRARQLINTAPALDGARLPSIDLQAVGLLMRCARDLIELSELSPNEPIKSARGLYRGLRQRFDRLLSAVTSPSLDTAKLDVLGELLIGARECVRREMEIELDFIAPIAFLQQRPNADDPIVDYESLRQQLSGYAAFHHDLSGARQSLLVMKDPGGAGVVIDIVGKAPEILTTRGQIAECLRSVTGADRALGMLCDTAYQFLAPDPVAADAAPLAPIPSGGSTVGEIIQLGDGDKLYAMLFFAYEHGATPAPSKRALSRMIPQVLFSEFMRTAQTHRLLALMFHHISTPIVAMRVMLTDLKNGYLSSEERLDYFEWLLLLVGDCQLMIRNQQHFVRITRGISPPIILESFDLVAEAEFRRRMINYKYKSARHTLNLRAPPSLQVKLDQLMVGDIIQNLLDNACKYSPARREVQIAVESNRRNVYITVIDEGPGLPAHTEASLFYREGVRGEAASSSSQEGLGLGLFMVRQYANWLKGDVWYERVTDRFTKFTVRLPTELKS